MKSWLSCFASVCKAFAIVAGIITSLAVVVFLGWDNVGITLAGFIVWAMLLITTFMWWEEKS